MIEYDVIQTRGFHNIEKDGEIIGFRFCVRAKQYRGYWLSMIRTEDVIVDGEVFKKDDIVWTIDGIDYTPAQMLEIGKVQFPGNRAATLTIKKQGGLPQGYHDIQFAVRYIHCYLPPRVSSDAAFAANPPVYEKKRMLLV
jgi:hypothetical protein